MTDAEAPLAEAVPTNPYRVFCILALLVLTMAMLERGMDSWSFVPTALGALSLLRAWRVGPIAVVLSFAVAVAASARGVALGSLIDGFGRAPLGGMPVQRLDPLPDLAACAAVLAFVAAHYRLQMTERFAFPPESLKWSSFFLGSKLAEGETPVRRAPQLATPLEFGLLAATLPLWTGLAALVFFWLSQSAAQLALIESAWRMPALLFWAVALGLALLGTLLGYQRQVNLRRDEALLYLQDQLWRQTRGEQQRVNRWLAWAHVRALRRKERS